MMKGNAVIGQSGGPTAAINATLSGVILGAKECGCIDKIYGMRNGIEGLLAERLVDLRQAVAGPEDHYALERTPASALGSCRKKLPAPDSGDGIYEDIFGILQKYDIKYFFYIGGNDSMDTVDKLSAYAAAHEIQVRFVGVPKTIDNDLCCTDHTPGFGSAAKYVATTVQEIARDCSVYTVRAVTVVEIMGRDAGWLTAAAGLPRLGGQITADLIYLPEKPFDQEKFITAVRDELDRKPNVVVAVSEGLRDAQGAYVGQSAQSGAVDTFGHKYLSGTAKYLELLVKDRIGCKVRSVELNLPQRCAGHLLSGADIAESVAVGRASAEAAADGATGVMGAFVRESTRPYRAHIEFVPVSRVCNKIKYVPDDCFNASADNVTDELLISIAPLVLGRVEIPEKNGLPVHFVID